VHKVLFQAMILVGLCFGQVRAEAEEDSHEPHWRLGLSVQTRLNPEGLSLVPELGYRTLLSKSSHLLLRDTYLEVGLITPVSPASFHPGAYVTLVPIAPIVLRVSAQQLRYFGLFGNLAQFPGTDPDWSDEARDGPITHGEHGTGIRVDGSATLRLKLGRVIAMSKYTHAFLGANIPKGSSWYEPTADLPFARNDQLQRVDATLGAFIMGTPKDKSFLLAAGHWQGYWTDKTDAERQIVGGLVIWRPGVWAERKFTVISLLATYLVDEYRSGGIYYGGAFKISWDRLQGGSSKP